MKLEQQPTNDYQTIRQALQQLANPTKAAILSRFQNRTRGIWSR